MPHHVFVHLHRQEFVAVVDTNVSPTNCGKIVERRDQILMISLRPEFREVSALASR